MPNELIQSVCLMGPSGAGKSTLLRGALEYYGSGIICLAPGYDESNSYYGLTGDYAIKGFDDVDFIPGVNKLANGHALACQWLRERRLELEEDLKAGKPLRYRALCIDTESGLARLGYNATLAKFNRDTPPPAQSPDGAAFYGHLRITLETSARAMRAIRGLGVHWLVSTHPTEADVTAIQEIGAAKSKVMPDLPGGFKNSFPAAFDTVLSVNVSGDGKRFVQYGGDPKKVIKSRLGALSVDGKIVLPDVEKVGAKAVWEAVLHPIEKKVGQNG